MQIFGLMIVRNEADIVRVNVLHHLALGVDRILIVDNGSEDGTDQILHELSLGGRVSFTRYSGLWRQAEITTQLALEAFRRGADWVIPIDADEFWYAPGGELRGVLTESTAGAISVKVVNFVQRREQQEASPHALLHMTRRAPEQIGPLDRVREFVRTQAYAFVEMVYPPKWISRASLALHIGVGNHEVMGVPGSFEGTDAIVCLHAPLRSRSVFHAQVGHARRAVEAGNFNNWHWERWKQLAERGELEPEWRANSYEERCLDVYGVAHSLVLDLRLRDLAAPWLDCTVNRGQAVPAPSLKEDSRLGQLELELVGPVLAGMNQIEGRFTDAEAHLLMFAATLALLRSAQAVVEVGSCRGRSTVVLGSVVKEVCSTARVYTIDPHEGKAAARKGSFDVPWSRPIGFLFIDGFHDDVNISSDFSHFRDWLSPGSYVAFHGYSDDHPDVRTFVDELLASGTYREFQLLDNLIVLERTMNGTEQDSPEPGDVASRLERQDRGIAVLRDILRDAITRSKAELAGRDKMIVDLQRELFQKVDERDTIIRGLQGELHEKVGECNRIIRELQAELHAKVGERDKIILDLQSLLGAAGGNPQT